jgi:hypothetical protein
MRDGKFGWVAIIWFIQLLSRFKLDEPIFNCIAFLAFVVEKFLLLAK